ncbi:hypothetical protein [Pseudorhodoplanes sp.]|jgi:hypothetical protein|uniref:hypothetical protein n=1 Tax=Pseudorhodoplanes sp. TaxID=1934341 RepID=UPI002C0CA600|nr:hypothetical protein [Pseudorhodoplanes sp.]HWV42027.1 hypothetical protein [Pseudorhodoplanes sp.]
MIGSGIPISHSRSPRPIVSLRQVDLSGVERPIPDRVPPQIAKKNHLLALLSAILMEIKVALQLNWDSHPSTNTVERF